MKLFSLRPVAALWLLTAALTLLAGCQCPCLRTRPLAAAAIGAQQDVLAGEWRGNWRSASGHGGKLLCTFTKLDGRHYRAHFTAYWLAFHGSYDVVLETRGGGDRREFHGEKDLGRIYGGVFHYAGSVAQGKFESRYTASSDHGTFSLARVSR